MKIQIPDFCELGEIKFKEPVFVDFYYEKERVAYFTWDFGMESELYLDSYFLSLKDYSTTEQKIIRQCHYDLAHAFFHHTDDPNYTYYHWALYGNLKDRILKKEIEY